MNDERIGRSLTALFRESGRLDVRAGKGGDHRRRGRERADALLARIPAISGIAATVGAAIVNDAESAARAIGIAAISSEHPDVPPMGAALPLGFSPAPPEAPDVDALRADAARRVEALDRDLDLAAAQSGAGDAAAIGARLIALLERHLAEVPLGDNPVSRTIPLSDVAVFSAAATDAATRAESSAEPWLLVTARLSGTGTLLAERGAGAGPRLAAFADRVHARLSAAAGAPSTLRGPRDRATLLAPNRADVRVELARARAELERDALLEFEATLVPLIVWHPVAHDAFEDGDRLHAAGLDAERARQTAPFCDALDTAGAFGPFAAPPQSATGGQARAEATSGEPVHAVAVITIDPRRDGDVPPSAPLLARLSTERACDALLDEPGGNGVEVLPWRGPLRLVRGPVADVARAVQRLAVRCRRLAGDEGLELNAGIACCAPGATTDAATWRHALDLLERAASDPRRGRTAALGALIPTRALDRHVVMGESLADLARVERGAVSALAAAAARVGNEALPVTAIERLKARIHEIAAMLGADARTAARADEVAGDPRQDALRALVRDLPRRFESGEARFALEFALIRAREGDEAPART